ncbi:hypothetical protein D6T64_13075 [Cryobacterium melibiosiphilum]|uniref:Lipoprotein n=1 Tax=Cryobacterium melibiosiphilum TaxID=995039 RepID=A0A3A5MCD1_9MICO|nr:hypothetical protein [Cryobacterium melibiosiphilum]RJT87787.1 hypothetical protein D6T64_13075 [Cryobacterium melibiosiphilum]
MKPIQRRIATLIGCVIAASALTSCAAPDVFTLFDEPQSAADILPTDDKYVGLGGLEDDTTRLLHDEGGIRYFASLLNGDEPCLIILDDEQVASSCSTDLPVSVTFKDGPEMWLADGPSNSEQDWTEVADHLWVSN